MDVVVILCILSHYSTKLLYFMEYITYLYILVRNHLVGVSLPHPHTTPHHHYILYNERYI